MGHKGLSTAQRQWTRLSVNKQPPAVVCSKPKGPSTPSLRLLTTHSTPGGPVLPPLQECSSSSMFQMHGRQLMRHGLGSEHERVATVRSWGAEPAPWIAASERARVTR